MVPCGLIYLTKRTVLCFGVILVVLHAIAWPSFIAWILFDIGLITVLILPRVLQLIKRTPTRADITIHGSVKSRGGGFSSAIMTEALIKSRQHGNSGEHMTRSNSRRARYDHEYSRYTPDERHGRTPVPTISAIKNRLSYRYILSPVF